MTTDWAAAINERICTRDVVRNYGIFVNVRGFCKCPFHSGGNEKTPSMMIYPRNRGYHCFACGETGDTIDFVRKMFNVSFRDACRKINDDFCLGLCFDGEISKEDRKRINRDAYERRKQRERFNSEKKRVFCAYYDALDRYTYYDRVIFERESNGDVVLDDEYITAKKNIARAKYMLDCAEIDLRNFEKKLE